MTPPTDEEEPARTTRPVAMHRGPAGEPPSLADVAAEAAGGVLGALGGAALLAAAGPLGTLAGGLAGALAGWWAGRAIAEAASTVARRSRAVRRRPRADGRPRER